LTYLRSDITGRVHALCLAAFAVARYNVPSDLCIAAGENKDTKASNGQAEDFPDFKRTGRGPVRSFFEEAGGHLGISIFALGLGEG
jgi:hypothetical protein